MLRVCLRSILASFLLYQPPLALAESSASATPKSVEAIFLELDASKAEVTYISATGQPRTSPVSSQEALVKLAKARGGQKVLLKCAPNGMAGECTVEDVKKKPNWLKRGLILVAIIVPVGAFISSPPTAP